MARRAILILFSGAFLEKGRVKGGILTNLLTPPGESYLLVWPGLGFQGYIEVGLRLPMDPSVSLIIWHALQYADFRDKMGFNAIFMVKT